MTSGFGCAQSNSFSSDFGTWRVNEHNNIHMLENQNQQILQRLSICETTIYSQQNQIKEYENRIKALELTVKELLDKSSSAPDGLILHECTAKVHGKTYIYQKWYSCYTCGLTQENNGKGCCEYCMRKCHQGHDIQYKGIVNAFCDCTHCLRFNLSF
ncbi:hypothetical protein TRFO_12833 [Tritrichomonas foetus]|uniref:UBR-type domain-containing protein n=1 Tax=Tritrichomonas foetus TaxID=1144522 RepID=A0A1J4L1K2_9EUKA|nr:hypothetical protein TRFO_12833 [Tritrichomonas foetus]|eukprot:OHT16944.1 hypothetical protein TRFO_12833 [Tritrichomonas foetus]